jgi:hypothetical protein
MSGARRKYERGKCGDCGWEKLVTTIEFWVNGYKMRACAECIKPYRDRIMKPVKVARS